MAGRRHTRDGAVRARRPHPAGRRHPSRHAVCLAGWVEVAEYDRIWVGEVNHVDAVSAATLAATGTDRTEIPLFCNVFTRAPTTLAMTASTLAQHAPGAEIVPRGRPPLFVEGWNGIPYRSVHQRLRDTLRFLRLAMAEGRVNEQFQTIPGTGFVMGSRPAPPADPRRPRAARGRWNSRPSRRRGLEPGSPRATSSASPRSPGIAATSRSWYRRARPPTARSWTGPCARWCPTTSTCPRTRRSSAAWVVRAPSICSGWDRGAVRRPGGAAPPRCWTSSSCGATLGPSGSGWTRSNAARAWE